MPLPVAIVRAVRYSAKGCPERASHMGTYSGEESARYNRLASQGDGVQAGRFASQGD